MNVGRQDAKRQGLVRYFTGKPCKHGHLAERFTVSGDCCECSRARSSWANLSAAQKHRSQSKRLVEHMTHEQRDQRRAYYRKVSAEDRARKLNATPAWADRAAIAAVYAEAERLTRETGIPHDVDHIVPLVSPLVCGLHVPANLRAIPASENRAKGNRFLEEV